MKRIFVIFILGLLLRLALMPISVHPDLRGHYLGAYFMSQKHAVLSMYDYISRLPRTDAIVNLYHDDFFVYSPLTYLMHASYLNLAKTFINWDLFWQFEVDIGSVMGNPGLPQMIFTLKLPYLIADIFCFVILLKLFPPRHRLWASLLWAANLPLIHSAFLMGQFDVFMILFILLGLLSAKSKRYSLTAACFALASGFKPFPLFFIPFIPGNKVKNIIIGGLTYFAIIAPFLSSPGYRMYALVAQHSDKMWYAKLMVSGSQYLPIFLVLLGLIFWLNYLRPTLLKYWEWPLLTLLTFYSVVHYHPQWFAWITPFWIFCFIYYRQLRFLLLTLLIFDLLILFSFESSLSFGLFGLDFSLFDYINRFYPKDQLVSFIRGGLASTSLAVSWYMLKHSDVHPQT